MPASSTAFNACDTVVKLDNASGTPVDVSGSSNKVDASLENMVGEFKPFGSDFYQRLTCGKDASISWDFVFSTANDEAYDLIMEWYYEGSGPRTFSVDAPDGSPGSHRYTFEVLLESLDMPFEADTADPIMGSAELKPTGAFTRALITS